VKASKLTSYLFTALTGLFIREHDLQISTKRNLINLCNCPLESYMKVSIFHNFLYFCHSPFKYQSFCYVYTKSDLIPRDPLTHHLWHVSTTSNWTPTRQWLDDDYILPHHRCSRAWRCG